VLVEANNSAASNSTSRTNVFSQGCLTDLANLLLACRFGYDELRRLFLLADLLALLEFFPFLDATHQQSILI
jgi:hypothetical protein